MKIIKLDHHVSEHIAKQHKMDNQISIEIGDRVKYFNTVLKWITGTWLQGFMTSSYRSDINHPGAGSNAYTGFDSITAVQKDGQGEWMPVKWNLNTNKYIVLPQLDLTGENNMKITKMADKDNNILRFDTDARLEIFVDQWDIQFHDKYKSIIAQNNVADDVKIKQLKEIATEIAMNKASEAGLYTGGNLGVQITPGDISVHVIDFERMPWDEMLHPDVE